jgi:cytidylate kinase
MRVSKAIGGVIALFGPSCVGKTTIAKELANLLSVPVRHCGEIVKRRAHEIGCDPSDLPDSIHREIDEQTRTEIISHSGTIIVEGRFLDCVLADVENANLVELTCSAEERRCRATRAGRSGDFVKLQDQHSTSLREKFYARIKPKSAFLSLSTESLNPSDAVKRIAEAMGKL